MDLTTILLMIVAVLMVLFGLLVLIGSAKKERIHLVWFFIAMLGGAVWTLSNGLQLWNTTGDSLESAWISYGICQGSVVATLGLLGYYLQMKQGRTRFFVMCLMTILSIIIMLLPFLDFGTLNSVLRGESSWFYTIYSIFLATLFIMLLVSAIIRIKRIESKKDRRGAIMLFVGTLATVTISMVFNMLFPFVLHSNEFLWVGPLSIYILVLAFYLNLFSTHRIALGSTWFKVLSYTVLIASCAVIYMVIFFLIFTSLFHVASPSPAVLFLNFIMIGIVLLLTPVISEVSAFVRSLISVDEINIDYVIKRLSKVQARDVDLHEMADFLASHLHFDYIGFVVNKRFYESEESEFTTDTLKALDQLKSAQHGIWQDLNSTSGKILKHNHIVAVAELCDDKGKVFGQMLIGKPIRKHTLNRYDLIRLETVVNMIATLIAPIKRLRK